MKKSSLLGWIAGSGAAMLSAIWVAVAQRQTSDSETVPPTVRNPTSDEQALRSLVVSIAAAKIGQTDPSEFWQEVYGPVWTKGLSWCGVFALYVLHKAGLTDAKWQTGPKQYGFIFPLKLRQTYVPEPGDIAYFEKYQHHAIVAAVNDDGTVTLINGNGEGGAVSESRTDKSKVTGFYSIDSLISAKLGAT